MRRINRGSRKILKQLLFLEGAGDVVDLWVGDVLVASAHAWRTTCRMMARRSCKAVIDLVTEGVSG
jgi:hypothetical protein